MSAHEHSIVLALHEAKRPLTAREIAVRTRTPISTVYRVVTEAESIQNVGGRPCKFYAERHAEMDANNIVVRYQKPAEGWLAWSETAKASVSQLLDIDTKSANQRALLAKGLRGMGILFMSLAKDIEDGVSRPDWRKKLDK